MSKAVNATVRSWQIRFGNAMLFGLARIAQYFPDNIALAIGRGLGWLAPRFSPRHLHRIAHDVSAAFGSTITAAEAYRIANASYTHLGESLVEFLRMPYMSTETIRQWVHLEGTQHVEAALAQGRGVILLTAHLGNWEICGLAMGLHYPTTAIARPQKDLAITTLFTRVREAHGLKVVPMTDVRECIRVLKRNECLGILGDLNAKPPGAFVQFFGIPASTYLGTAYLAQVSGAAIIPLFDERLPDHTHRVRIGPPIPQASTGDRQRDLFITTIRTQEVIEREIRRRPDEWYWLVQRWKTRPEHVADPARIPMEHRDLTTEESSACRTWDGMESSTRDTSAQTPRPTP